MKNNLNTVYTYMGIKLFLTAIFWYIVNHLPFIKVYFTEPLSIQTIFTSILILCISFVIYGKYMDTDNNKPYNPLIITNNYKLSLISLFIIEGVVDGLAYGLLVRYNIEFYELMFLFITTFIIFILNNNFIIETKNKIIAYIASLISIVLVPIVFIALLNILHLDVRLSTYLLIVVQSLLILSITGIVNKNLNNLTDAELALNYFKIVRNLPNIFWKKIGKN